MSGTSLEYERKEAKAFLKQIRAGDADALRRLQLAHAVALRDRAPNELQLADAQHVIAREHGFASWPRLVEYFEEMERHRLAPRRNSSERSVDHLVEQARAVVRRHQRGDPVVLRELAHFVPRFYGRPARDIRETPITEDEARLVVARENRRASWEELIERANASRELRDGRVWQGESEPVSRARAAVRGHDVAALAAMLDEHPDLLKPSVVDREWRSTLVSIAINAEYEAGTPEARRVTDLLASRGADIQRELNERLLGFPHDMEHRADRLRWYLDRGADPNWLPPNGITVLEHAIVRYRDGACVDLIAERVRPRRALWIAAGLGDVVGVRSFIAGAGKLTPEGGLNRPDLMAMGLLGELPPNHEAGDLEIMSEAFRIAGWNGRWAAMDALLEAGLPVDHAPLPWPLIIEAVGSMLVPLAEYLVRRGADLDRNWGSAGNARAIAREHFRSNPKREIARRLLAICGAGTPDDLLAELDAKRPSPPRPDQRTLRAMQLAADDAARQEQSTVTTVNMLVGLLRVSNGVFASTVSDAGADMAKLRATLGARLLPDADPLAGQQLPADADAEAAVLAAAAEADSRRRDSVSCLHLLKGIASRQNAPGAELLADVGATAWERLDSAL